MNRVKERMWKAFSLVSFTKNRTPGKRKKGGGGKERRETERKYGSH